MKLNFKRDKSVHIGEHLVSFLIRLLVFIMFGFIVISCRTMTPVIESERVYSGDEIYAQMADRYADVNTYSAGRMNLTIIENEEELNLHGSVRILKDSAIILRINAFAGIEAARILLTKDSIKILDRINRSYFLGTYEEAPKFFPVNINFDIVQSLFFGSSVKLLDEFNLPDRNFTGYSFENNSLALRYTGNIFPNRDILFGEDMLQIILDSDFLTRSIEIFSSENDIYSKVSFNSFKLASKHYLPEDIDFHFVSHEVPLYANFRLSRIEINQEISFPFSIPSRYKSY